MYSSQSGSYDMVNSNICQSCGSVTMTHEETASNKMTGITYVVLGWIFFSISLLFIPILFGALALSMGFFTYSERSKTHGVILMLFAAMGLVLGSLFSFMVAGTMFI